MKEDNDNKSFIMQLYEDQVDGVRNLYTDIGYLMRMELWESIDVKKWQELSEDCHQKVPQSETRAREFFYNILYMMDEKIPTMAAQLRGQMLCDRNRIEDKFSANPVKFVHAMAKNFETENQLLFRYTNLIQSQNTSIDEVPCQLNVASIAESEQFLQDFKGHLAQLDRFRIPTNPNFGSSSAICSSPLVPQNLVQLALNCLENLINSLQACEDNVIDLLAKAGQADAFRSISLTPHHQISYEELSPVCDRYTAMLYDLVRLFHYGDYKMMFTDGKFYEAEKTLDQLKNNFFQRNMVFTKHPKEVILVTNNDKGADKEVKMEQGQTKPPGKGKGQKNAQKEKAKVYDTKKKESIDAKVSILGLGEIKDHKIVSHCLTLATEQQLASLDVTSPASSGTIRPTPELPQSGEIEFKNLKIEGYERANDSVYEQMMRLQYVVEIQVFGETYCLKAYSLPFFLCTGAIQVLELLGSRMWYLANKSDLFHGDFQVISALHHEEVIKMLDNRIKSTCPAKKRALTHNGKEFLKERIPEIDSQGKLTLHTIIKDKMKKVPDDRQTESVECYKFTFFAWFYALVRSIEREFADLWHDGIIYELFSFRDSREFLLAEGVSSGCVLLRPGLSKVYKPNSLDAHVRLIADIKVRYGGQWKVCSFPINPEHLDTSTLYNVVSNLSAYDIKPKSIFTTNGIRQLSVLKDYHVKQGKVVYMYHGMPIVNIPCLRINSECNELPTEEDLDTGARRRKTARQDSNLSYGEPVSSVSSTEPLSADPSPRSADTDINMSSDAVSPASQTCGHEMLKTSPPNEFTVNTEVKLEVNNKGNNSYSNNNNNNLNNNNNWQKFGDNIKVDVSQLPNVPGNSHVLRNMLPLDIDLHRSNNSNMNFDFLHMPEAILETVPCSPSTIPTTVQEINTITETDAPRSTYTFILPGWTDGDVIDALEDGDVMEL